MPKTKSMLIAHDQELTMNVKKNTPAEKKLSYCDGDSVEFSAPRP